MGERKTLTAAPPADHLLLSSPFQKVLEHGLRMWGNKHMGVRAGGGDLGDWLINCEASGVLVVGGRLQVTCVPAAGEGCFSFPGLGYVGCACL